MTFAAWLSLVAVCALGAASPGPSLAVVVRHSITGSRLQGAACALAHAVGVGLYALSTVLGLAVVIANRPRLYLLLATAGACYLTWLGVQTLRRVSANAAAAAGSGASPGWPAAMRDGFTIALLNPKIALFFLALFSQFVGPSPGVFETLVLSLTAMSVDAAWYLLVALVLSGSAIDGLRRRTKSLSVFTGSMLLAIAGWTLARLWFG